MLTQKRLKQVLEYRDGDFYWIANTGKKQLIGSKAGKIANNLYVHIQIDCISYLAQQLVWLYFHGYIPQYLDHKDGDTLHNRLENLRSATAGQNQVNSDRPVRGYEIHGNKYRARIQVEGCRLELGSYDSLEEAQAVYSIALDKYFGEFAYRRQKSLSQ